MFDTSVAPQLLGESLLLCFKGGMFFVPQFDMFKFLL